VYSEDVPSTDPVIELTDVPLRSEFATPFSRACISTSGSLPVVKVQYDRTHEYGVWTNGAYAQLAIAF
jgi:hypothetical protein